MPKAPIDIKVEDATKTVEHLARILTEKELVMVQTRAINTAIQKANTGYRRQIVKEYNLKYADTKPMVILRKATYGKLEGTISGEVKPVSLSRFNPDFIKGGQAFSIRSIKNKETKKRGLVQKFKRATKKDTFKGVNIEVKKGNKKNIPFAFLIQTDKPGISKQIWARGSYLANKFNPGKNRMPITALKTVSPYSTMVTEEAKEKVGGVAGENMRKEFIRQVNLLIYRVKK